MKIRFQADADLNEDIVAAVIRHESSVDFQTATEAGLEGLNDLEVLALAARESYLRSFTRKAAEIDSQAAFCFF